MIHALLDTNVILDVLLDRNNSTPILTPQQMLLKLTEGN